MDQFMKVVVRRADEPDVDYLKSLTGTETSHHHTSGSTKPHYMSYDTGAAR
jgi:hypothetical protein